MDRWWKWKEYWLFMDSRRRPCCMSASQRNASGRRLLETSLDELPKTLCWYYRHRPSRTAIVRNRKRKLRGIVWQVRNCSKRLRIGKVTPGIEVASLTAFVIQCKIHFKWRWIQAAYISNYVLTSHAAFGFVSELLNTIRNFRHPFGALGTFAYHDRLVNDPSWIRRWNLAGQHWFGAISRICRLHRQAIFRLFAGFARVVVRRPRLHWIFWRHLLPSRLLDETSSTFLVAHYDGSRVFPLVLDRITRIPTWACSQLLVRLWRTDPLCSHILNVLVQWSW